MTAPRLTNIVSTITFAENPVNAAPQVLDGDVTFVDPDSDFEGGMLSITGLLAEDTISVRDDGTGAGQIGLTGSNVTYEGVTIGTVSGGVGAPFSITFNVDATSTAIDALIQNLTYANSSDTPTSSRDLVLNVVDATGMDTNPPTFAQLTGAANPLGGIDVQPWQFHRAKRNGPHATRRNL